MHTKFNVVITENAIHATKFQAYDIRQAKVKLMNGNTVTIETDGLLSRAIQHETDHLNGVLFIDRMSAATRIALRGKVKRMQRDYGMR